MKKTILFLSFVFLTLTLSNLYAKEAIILYTGQTHAMLYTCSCPIEQDGGVARRSTLVKELRKKYPDLLLLDAGSFTAGGLMDEYTQNSRLDMQRSEINLKAMELMRYDAVGVGPDEFNFGKDFFLKNARKTNPAFLGANLDSDKVAPYIIKETGGVKIGIIGLTNLEAGQKSEGLKINQAKSIGTLVSRLKKQGVEVIAVLSTLGENEDLRLISQVKGIDILFIGYNPAKVDLQTKVDSTFLLRPVWQGRALGKLTLEVKDGKLLNCKIEEIKLSDKFADDPGIKAILPRCYSDVNCKKEGFVGSCENQGESKSSCTFTKPNTINLLVISAKDCATCNAGPVLAFLKEQFPGITAEYVYLPEARARKLINDLSIKGLPAYILGREIEREKNFARIKDNLELKGNSYLLKPLVGGISYFFDRQAKKGSFDLFLSLFEKETDKLLKVTKEFKPTLHFLAVKKGAGFDAQNGVPETEEYLRAVCVQKYYPKEFWDYLICRSKNINSSWWEDCLDQDNAPKVKTCSRGPEGANLLKKNISLNKELEIMFGPTYLLDNREIFSSRGVPDREELRKTIKR
jgi:5'-nucleotidase